MSVFIIYSFGKTILHVKENSRKNRRKFLPLDFLCFLSVFWISLCFLLKHLKISGKFADNCDGISSNSSQTIFRFRFLVWKVNRKRKFIDFPIFKREKGKFRKIWNSKKRAKRRKIELKENPKKRSKGKNGKSGIPKTRKIGKLGKFHQHLAIIFYEKWRLNSKYL